MNRARKPLRRLIVAVITGALVLPVLSTAVSSPAQARRKACTDVIKGENNATINVVDGQRMCLKKAQQNGDVNVASGGSLKVIKSKIAGAVNVNPGFVKFKMCKSEITTADALTVSGGGTKSILIGTGNNRSKCPGNTFGGVVNVEDNDGALKMKLNTVAGAVNVISNNAGVKLVKNTITGAVTVNDNTVKTVLKGNTITGALSCAGNDPEPVNGGKANTVGGARSGQCLSPSF